MSEQSTKGAEQCAFCDAPAVCERTTASLCAEHIRARKETQCDALHAWYLAAFIAGTAPTTRPLTDEYMDAALALAIHAREARKPPLTLFDFKAALTEFYAI